jgi:small-conductance mechanosensitive channel
MTRTAPNHPAGFDTILLGNTLEQWAIALGAAAGTWLLLAVLRALVARRVGAWLATRSQHVAAFVGRLLQRTNWLLVFGLALWVGARCLAVPAGVAFLVHAVVVALVALQVVVWSFEAIEFLLKLLVERRRGIASPEDPGFATALPAMQFLGRLVVVVTIVLLALQNLGVDITALVAGLGVGGVAIALAVQNILGDLFASLSILLDKPFVVGDAIVVGNQSGTVEKIGLKTTRVRSGSGEQLIFANSDLLSSRIQNFKRMQERRVVVRLAVTYQTPMDLVEQLPAALRQCVESQPKARFDRAHFVGFGASSLDFEIVYLVRDAGYDTYMDVNQAIHVAMGRRFEALGVRFAHPTQTLYVARSDGRDPASRMLASR